MIKTLCMVQVLVAFFLLISLSSSCQVDDFNAETESLSKEDYREFISIPNIEIKGLSSKEDLEEILRLFKASVQSFPESPLSLSYNLYYVK